jgi:C_GCAxxG_C_C family probable redox protein
MGQGNVCGAVAGAFMVLGLKLRGDTDEREARHKTSDLASEFVTRFRTRYGTIVCKELLGGVDLATKAGRRQAAEQRLFTTICPKFVRTAAQILDELQ